MSCSDAACNVPQGSLASKQCRCLLPASRWRHIVPGKASFSCSSSSRVRPCISDTMLQSVFHRGRTPDPPLSLQGSVSIINILLGIGILSMPYAMRGSGSAGLLSVLLCCFLFCTTGKFIHWGLDMIPDSAPRDYPGLGEASLGLLGRRLVSIAAAAELFGAACMSLLIMWRSTEVCCAPILHNPLTRARITARAPAHRLSQGQHGSCHSGPGQAQALTGLCKRPSDGSNRKVSWRWVSTPCNTAEHAPVPPRCISHVPLAWPTSAASFMLL